MLSAEISRKYGEAGLPDDTITVDFNGNAGQSFGAFGPRA
jgi:glutamate synthase (NADPH) large chain